MLHLLDSRAGLGLILLLGVGLSPVWGQPKPEPPAPKKERLLIGVRNVPVKDLAALLSQHLKNEEVQILPDPNCNSLLVNGPAAVMDEIMKLVGQLDRAAPAPQILFVEVLIAEVMPPAKGADKPAEIAERELTGPVDGVMKKIEALKKEGRLGTLKRLQNAVVENLPSRTMVGESKPYITGSVVRPGGLTSNMISYRNVGTQLTVTAHLTSEKVIQMELGVEDSRMSTPEDGVQLGTNDKGAPILATEFITATVNSKLSVPLGEAVVVSGVKTTSKAQSAHTLVIVTARLAGGEAKGRN